MREEVVSKCSAQRRIEFESNPRTNVFARSAKDLCDRDFRNVVRGKPVRGYREYVRGL